MAGIKDVARVVKQNVEGVTQKSSEALVVAVLDAVKAVTLADPTNKLILRDFGSFEVLDTKAREVKNPKTGEVVAVEASKRVHFRPSTVFKNEAKENKAKV